MKQNPSSLLHSGIKQSYYCKKRKEWWACAPATIFYALSSMGIKTSPEEIISLAKFLKSEDEMKMDGLQTDEIKWLFRHYNVKSKLIKVFTCQDLYYIIREAAYHFPILIFPPEHVISVFKAAKSWVYFIEPDDIQKFTSCLRLSDFKDYCFGNQSYTEVMLLHPN